MRVIDTPGKSGIEGDFDLYIAFSDNWGKWSFPLNMGDKLNTPLFEGAASVSPDGEYSYFSRFTDGISETYRVDVSIITSLIEKAINYQD